MPIAVMSAPIASSICDAIASCDAIMPTANCGEVAANESRCARIIGSIESLRIDMPRMPDICPLCSGALSFFPHAAITRIAAKPALNFLIMIVLPFR